MVLEKQIEAPSIPLAEEPSRVLPFALPGKAQSWESVSAARISQVVDEVVVPGLPLHTIMINVGQPYRLEERLDGRLYKTFGVKGDAAIVPAGLPTEFRAREPQQVESFVMNLDPAYVRRIAEGEGVDADGIELVGSLGGRDPRLEQISMSLLSELENEDFLGGLYADSLATLLAVHLLRNHSSLGLRAARNAESQSAGGLSKAALRQVTDYIEDNIARDLTLQEIAGVAHMSPFHFSRVFKHSTGLSPQRYVVRHRVQRAKKLLVNTDLPLSEVARLSGFSDQSHLAKYTRRLLGATPRSLRRHVSPRQVGRSRHGHPIRRTFGAAGLA